MRIINKIIPVTTTITEEQTATNEEFTIISENKNLSFIDAVVELKNSSGTSIGVENYRIQGDKYNLLMSASPSFAVGKPENEYRESDLWYIIDQIRQEQSNSQ